MYQPNGLASRSIPEGDSGSGGTGETPSQLCTISGKSRLRGAAQPLPVLSLSKGSL
jgi:hypothetical protein